MMLSTCNDLHTIQRELEIITEAFESLESMASANEMPSSQLGYIMTPLCLNLGNIIDKLQYYCSTDSSAPIADFVQKRRETPRINAIETDRDKIRSVLNAED